MIERNGFDSKYVKIPANSISICCITSRLAIFYSGRDFEESKVSDDDDDDNNNNNVTFRLLDYRRRMDWILNLLIIYVYTPFGTTYCRSLTHRLVSSVYYSSH
jgi:hypothetical protein